jgi:nitrogen fixation/metabolism regulation signal transduction histidine kinase
MQKQWAWFVLCGVLAVFCLNNMWRHYKRFNQNILFLLNALDNGDYSFHFSENSMSRREKELNAMLNRIKEILTNARKAVIENEKFLSLIVESVSTGIVIVDEHWHVQTVNRSALDLLGLPVFTHLNQLSGVNETFPSLFKEMKTGDNLQIVIPNEREEMQVSLRMSEIKLKEHTLKIITLNNIGSELETKEMESWVRLIRVMTHEIMNSIAPITSLSETLLTLHRRPQGEGESADSLRNNSIEAFDTIHSTARGLLSFVESYRKFTAVPKPEIRPFSIKYLLDKAVKLEEPAMIQRHISLKVEPADEATTMNADENLIFQVLVNLIKNAVEAIPETGGELRLRYGYQPSGRSYIEVCNSGKPIPADVLPHIFIPFFTTKESGNGIGLSVSRYIMRLHGGKLLHSTSADGMTVLTVVS